MDDMILEIRHLSKSFGSHEVLRDIDFTVKKGDVTSIIGASGSGKSTLLRCINLLETPTSGEILYRGQNVTGPKVNAPQYRSHVGMVFQSFNLFNNMTVLENCMVGQIKVLKKDKETARKRAMEYLEKVGMAPYIQAKPRQISGGQKQRVAIARHPQRPNITDYIQALFTDFFEQKGDRLCGEDAAILGGVALYHGRPVTVIGTRKGKTLEENLKCNFGMPNPEGYRKALRLMRQAEKFRRPILTFIDTSGAYPGLEAEAHGQGEAIARNLYEMSRLTVPVIALITGEGNSGGALALGVANRVLMLENSVYAILSPEGFASILWKDSARHEEACELMKLTAPDLLELGVIDGIIPEPEGGAHLAPAAHMRQVDRALSRCLAELSKESGAALAAGRYQKFRRMGAAPQKEEA